MNWTNRLLLEVIFRHFSKLKCYTGNIIKYLPKKQEHLQNNNVQQNVFCCFIVIIKGIIVDNFHLLLILGTTKHDIIFIF